jgi:hypothetical protein
MFNREPAMILAAVEAAIVVAVVFGLDITDDQKEAILAFGGAILSLVTGLVIRSQVTPVRS